MLTGAMLIAAPVFAQQAAALPRPDILRLSDGNNAGPLERNAGPGAEQAHTIMMYKSGQLRLVTIWMSSQIPRDDPNANNGAGGQGPYQCKCTSVAMSATLGPQIVKDAIQLTENQGNRPCNHPRLAADVSNPAVDSTAIWVYGSNDPDQSNVATYAQALDADCNIIPLANPQGDGSNPRATNRLQINDDNNNNEAAPDIHSFINGLFQASYYSNGNNKTYAVGLTLNVANGQADIEKLYSTAFVDNANIGRPSGVAIPGTEKSFMCAAEGDNRPPEVGVRCALLNARTGDILWSDIIAASNPNGIRNDPVNPRFYMNSPQVSIGTNGRVHVLVEKTSGGGRDGNGGDRVRTGQRGSTQSIVYTLLVNSDNTVQQLDMKAGIGNNQVHASVCSGGFGTDGAHHLAVIDGSITGSGIMSAQFATFDTIGNALTSVGPIRALNSENSDSGLLANLYGQNPNDQGRDFERCVGNIPNAGFGLANGYRPEVKTFFAFPHAGRVDPDPKNSLFLAILPAWVPAPPPAQQWALTIAVSGDGTGKVSSQPIGISSCANGQMCQAMYDQGTIITLTATPDPMMAFAGWSGACQGAAQCVVRMSQAQNVTATFSHAMNMPQIVPTPVTVVYQGSGTGMVVSNPEGLNCNANCNANFPQNSMITLSAMAATGSQFQGWGGACAGVGDCHLTVDQAKNVTAIFNLLPVAGNMTTPQQPAKNDHPNGNPNQAQNAGMNPQNPTKTINTAVSCGCNATRSSGGDWASLALALGLFGVLVARRRK
jgi:hypothetical protein